MPITCRAALRPALAALAVLVTPPACTAQPDGGGRGADRPPQTIRVPQDAHTITAALHEARSGDLVLVSPGVYRETVEVDTDHVVVRGTDRNQVVIDGEGRRGNGILVTAAGVSVENLTVRDHLLNGILVTGLPTAAGGQGYDEDTPDNTPPLSGFRVRYVTAYNNGLYGIYAFHAQHGVLEQNYTSGSADSGIYVGQCRPCHVLVRDNVAERNAVGYESTNASGPIWVVHNRFSRNRVGLTVNSSYLENLAPQEGGEVVGNLVTDNAEAATPEQADGGFGIGIGISGGQRNLLARNRVESNPHAGLILASSEDIAPIGNRIDANTFGHNGVDVAYLASARAPGRQNCLNDNGLHSPRPALPPDLPRRLTCPGPATPLTGAALPPRAAPPGIAFRDVAPPPPQPQLPDAATAHAEPATDLPETVSTDAVPIPPATLYADRTARTR